ncbi:hypothetical protein K493DRAFT_387894 [Basidiobolus meristosporus CBS 931.73]|uniref:Cyclin N-terminal domain-containing protein n=1 Tax=Basidiobolus meristosporus CBS 931.73 TaxID=1314790 RepID=A0A1Y1XDE7_9FUNG|nr:hypothetical protein K493DRAFT_387894 [Basidiobolus meristosporus CBS 931.73]|eukprot:ORX83753.1 hypothetical protein K493DRAFT_387894 [Basidiobolus meristosporus CBS 931.73]
MSLTPSPRYDLWSPVSDQLLESTAHFLDGLPFARSTRASLFQFVKSVVYRGRVNSFVLASALVYLERLTGSGKLPLLQATSKELVFLACLLVASKYLDDRALTVSKVVGITRDRWTRSETSRLAWDLFSHLNYKLGVSLEELNRFLPTK